MSAFFKETTWLKFASTFGLEGLVPAAVVISTMNCIFSELNTWFSRTCLCPFTLLGRPLFIQNLLSSFKLKHIIGM